MNDQYFDLKGFGRKLRQLREEKDLTQDEVAKAVGVYKNHVSNWENGKSKPSLDSVIAISRLFAVSIDYLIFGNVPREGVEAINDLDLYEYFRKTEPLPKEKKDAVKMLIDGIVLREKLKDIPEMELTKQQQLPTLAKVAGKK
jgi:transcriptional regulator with XRE-family HTH domain